MALLRKMRVGRDIRDLLGGFEEAAAEMEPVMKAVRELDIKPHNEMVSGKVPETFSIFKRRVGSKEGEESETTLEEEESEEEEPKEKDDDVDFDVTDEDVEFEEEKDEEEVQPDEPPEPEWPDIERGPLTGGGTFDVEPCTGDPRFLSMPQSGQSRDLRRRSCQGLGYPGIPRGHFTTVTRVVAANPDGLPKVIISYAVEAMPKIAGVGPRAVEGRRG